MPKAKAARPLFECEGCKGKFEGRSGKQRFCKPCSAEQKEREQAERRRRKRLDLDHRQDRNSAHLAQVFLLAAYAAQADIVAEYAALSTLVAGMCERASRETSERLVMAQAFAEAVRRELLIAEPARGAA